MTKSGGLKLNKEQIEAIKYKKGPLLIIAGAGTGKTAVVSERIKYLILGKFAKPDEVLALTFTEKAAKEMEERVDVSMPYGYTQMWISTFHSFCDRILRAEALHIGLDPKYKLMTQSETVQFIRNNIFKFNLDYFRPLGNPTKFVTGMLQHFSRLQDEDVNPQEYLAFANKLKKIDKLEIQKIKELVNAYKTYDELKVKNSLLDFGDLIIKTLDLFRRRSNILKVYRKQFKYVLVDEFQDTNYGQNELVKLLVGKKGNVTVVADDDQCIYRFRGAAVSNVVQFRKSFPKTKIIVLSRNYRSTQEILDRSYDLIQFNNPDRLEVVEKINKKLISQVGPTSREASRGDPITFIHSDRVENEAEEVAKKVSELTNQATKPLINYKDIAILVRANNHAEPFMRAFTRKGIPYQFLGPGRLFKQPEIIDLISYLKVLYNFEDSVALYRILSMDYFAIPPRDLATIGNFARRYNISLFEACDPPSHEASEGQGRVFISKESWLKINKIVDLIKKHLGLVRKETAGQLLYYFLENTGLLIKMLSPESPEAEKKALNISKLFDKLKTYEVDHEDATVSAVVDWLELSSELGESPLAADIDWNDVNAVNILTAHSAKGLEFPVVFLVNLVSQRFPTTERREQIPIPDKLIKEILPVGDYHTQEERRLFYVGMTRAKDRLYLTAADYYGEGKREKKLSPFIFEALGEQAADGKKEKDKQNQLSFLDYKPKTKSSEALSKVERAKEGEPLRIDYLSYSQIDTFKICPLHYKLKYIYKVPTPQSASQSFGTSMHATLKNFYEMVKTSLKPSEKLIIKLLQENWIREGFSSKKQEADFFEKGKLYLSGFVKNEFNPKIMPAALELPFTAPLRSVSRRGVVPLRIGGRLDRVDRLPDGSIEIVDYKTGATIPSQKEVDKNLQLSFYALAASSIPQPPFGIKPEKIKLSLYFLDSQEKITTTRTKEDLEKAVEEIFKIRDEIGKSEFKCSGHMFCQGKCEYSLFCKSD
ncbi:MAG: ATP-dependent DNA helicase [bacterium]|nr:ATP-dependent DNA helicase [bacterium]